MRESIGARATTSCNQRIGRMQTLSHQPVFRSTSTLPRCPAGTQYISGLAVHTIRRIDSQLPVHLLVDAGRAHMTVKVRDFRGDIAADQEM